VPIWLRERVPEWLWPFLNVLLAPHVLVALGVFSCVMFVASAVGVPLFLARLPADYFSKRERHKLGLRDRPEPVWHLILKVLKNVLGALLILLGFAMLALPGQGLLTIIVGIIITDFPGKHRLERAIIARPSVFRGINALRRRAGRPPLERGSWA
jgi:hypothetical protein